MSKDIKLFPNLRGISKALLIVLAMVDTCLSAGFVIVIIMYPFRDNNIIAFGMLIVATLACAGMGIWKFLTWLQVMDSID
jgi:Flp pilus assembly protein protease CpaA